MCSLPSHSPMLWPSLFLSLSRSWRTVPETGADHNWHLHCPSSSWHHVCGGLLQNQVNFSLLFYMYSCWSGPSQLTVASNPLSITLYMGFSRGELKRQICGQGALVPARGVQVSMSISNAKIRQVSERFLTLQMWLEQISLTCSSCSSLSISWFPQLERNKPQHRNHVALQQ